MPRRRFAGAGRNMTATEVIEEVAKDMDFYRNSGGGVTFSGGEPFAQPAFLHELLLLAKERGISTAVETCGYAMPQHLKAAEPLVDHFLFDLKVMDPVRHAQFTGRDNDLILSNLELLASLAPARSPSATPSSPAATTTLSTMKRSSTA